MTGADMVLTALEREGVDVVFGYPGGANLPIYQRLPGHPAIRHVLVRHEQGAAHMADGYARATGKPGVVFATSGPGALNLVTGLATAFMDSVPMVAITGQVNTSVVGRDAFQESDVIGCTLPVTKHNYLGHGVILSRAEQELLELAERTGIPVGTTLLGIGAFPTEHPLSLHMTGFMGTGWCLRAVQNADLLMMVGMRVDDRVTAKLAEFAPKVKTFIHVDIDGAEMGKNVRPHIELVADAKQALDAILPHVANVNDGRRAWLTQIDAWREEHPLRYKHSNGQLQPQDVLIDMYRRANSEAIVVADVGQNQIWAALWWKYARNGLFINSGGAGTMGFALPAALGAKVGRPDKAVWCVAGEGGFLMTAQEMSVAVEQSLDVKVVLLNNFSLGMVRQFQDDFYGGVRSQVDLTVMPDFLKLADAYGWKAARVEKPEDIAAAFDAAERTPGPFLIDFRIDPEANVYPIVPLGKGLDHFQEEPYDI